MSYHLKASPHPSDLYCKRPKTSIKAGLHFRSPHANISCSANSIAWLVPALRDSVRDSGWSPHTSRFFGSAVLTEEQLTGMFVVNSGCSSSSSGFFRVPPCRAIRKCSRPATRHHTGAPKHRDSFYFFQIKFTKHNKTMVDWTNCPAKRGRRNKVTFPL